MTAFNAPALFARWRGIRLGYAHCDDIADELRGLRLPAKAWWVRRIGLVAAVFLLLASLIVPPWGGAMSVTGIFVFGAALALRRAGVPKEELTEFFEEAISGHYDHLLQTCMRWVTTY